MTDKTKVGAVWAIHDSDDGITDLYCIVSPDVVVWNDEYVIGHIDDMSDYTYGDTYLCNIADHLDDVGVFLGAVLDAVKGYKIWTIT